MLKVLKYFAWGTLVLAIFGAIAASSTTLEELRCLRLFLENPDLAEKCESAAKAASKRSVILILAAGIGSAITLGFMYCVLKCLRDIREQLAKS